MRIFHRLLILLTILTAAAGLSSCTMIQDDTDYCPNGLYVRFVYDYNLQYADMFKDQVGHITLYVYDEQGHKVAERSVSNTSKEKPLKTYGYTMHFDPAELGAGKYRLVAIGMQRDWHEALATKGAKMRRPSNHSHFSDLVLSLDHPELPDPTTGYHHVDHQNAPLDTLWHTLKVMADAPTDGMNVPSLKATSAPFSPYPLEEQYVTVVANRATYATVSLIRDTKHINLTLRQIDDPADIDANDYEVSIVDDNSTVGHDNEIIPCHKLRYSPYAYWTSRFDADGVTIENMNGRSLDSRAESSASSDIQRTAHYNLMTNRMMHDPRTPANNARLRVVNKNSGVVVADINLPSMLSEGRHYLEREEVIPSQEYLDRSYEYHLQMFLRGDKWDHVSITVNQLSWNKRQQEAAL